MTTIGEVFVVTSSGSGHLFPCIELCKQISLQNYKATLVHPSNTSAALDDHRQLIGTIEITAPIRGLPKSDTSPPQMGLEFEAHLSGRSNGPNVAHPMCAIIDFQMGRTKHIFWKHKIPVISFFTFGACAASMEWGAWKSNANENKLNPGQIHTIPGLPEETHIAYHDLTRHHNRPPQTSTGRGGGPPKPGDQPPRVPLIEGSIALMFNTCDDLEHPFINYLENQMGIPVWGIGPLFSDKYWASIKSNTLIHDLQIRNLTYQKEDQVKQWLDSKSQESVLYVAFGSELSPTNEELNQLASAWEEIDYPFIWVIQNRLNLSENEEKSEGFFGLDDKIGERGLIIQGWAPQLLILSHKSIGGFLSHCGWNSIVEAIGLGVPILAWPIRGDQIYNAKLVVNYLKIGYLALPSGSPEMVKMDLLNGIEKVISDEGIRKWAGILRAKLEQDFPASLEGALDKFKKNLAAAQV
ncbi:scopoletin glucosyltransferase-like [Olea europaea subsp. europaea]|uniref:Glycosyltransferase n=1 Tax=Olea europaea subsp. europaea TaxID=158383 RepID=A0A8S0UXK0_OLEEU|nr:scopoletin glucosyltransferase-like [Olea europaea subsp. europaea]